MAVTSAVPPFAFNMSSGDLVPNNMGLLPYSPFHPGSLPPSNHVGFISSPNVSAGLILSNQGPITNQYGPSLPLSNGYYSNGNYANGVDSLCFVPSNDAHIFGAYQTYPPLTISHPTNGCSNLYPPTGQTAITPESSTQSETATSGASQDNQNGAAADSAQSKDLNCFTDSEVTSQNSSLLVIRLLMSGKEVGSIIGKRGENVKKYREESGARINISDGTSPERIVTITGTTEQIHVAFRLMSRKFEDDFTQGLLRMGDDSVTCPPVTLRLLVPVAQCGSIIGKGGSKIKDVRELTGASVQVASEALPTSTERTVTISGTADAIAKCIQYLCEIFLECPTKGPVILYRPKPVVTNQTLLCPGPHFTSNILHPSLTGLPITGSEAALDSTYSIPCTAQNLMFNSSTLLPNDGTSANPSTIAQAYGPQFGVSSNVLSMNGASTGAPTLSSPNVITSPLNVMQPSRNINELLNDPVQILAALNQHDLANFTSQFPSFLPPLPPNVLPAAVHSITSPLSIPELALNQGVLGCYSSGSLPLVGSTGGFIYPSQPNLLKVSNGLIDEQFSSSANMSETVTSPTDSPNGCPTLSDPQQSHPQSASSVVGMRLPTSYVSASTQMDMNGTRSLNGLQSSASLLGLPSLSFPTILNSQPNALLTNPGFEETMVREMVISNDVIGCIIGRGGTTINEIRNLSKAQIKISNCEDGAKERKITVTGRPDAVNLAQFLINNSIVIHQEMWSFNVRLASAATALMTGCGIVPSSQIGKLPEHSNLANLETRNHAAKSLANQSIPNDSNPTVPMNPCISKTMVYLVEPTKVASDANGVVQSQGKIPADKHFRLAERSKLAPY